MPEFSNFNMHRQPLSFGTLSTVLPKTTPRHTTCTPSQQPAALLEANPRRTACLPSKLPAALLETNLRRTACLPARVPAALLANPRRTACPPSQLPAALFGTTLAAQPAYQFLGGPSFHIAWRPGHDPAGTIPLETCVLLLTPAAPAPPQPPGQLHQTVSNNPESF